MAREQSSLIGDVTPTPESAELPTVAEALDRSPGGRAHARADEGFVDDLDDDPDEPPLEHGSFYDNVLEVR